MFFLEICEKGRFKRESDANCTSRSQPFEEKDDRMFTVDYDELKSVLTLTSSLNNAAKNSRMQLHNTR